MPFLEALDRTTEIAADRLQALRAEDQHDDQEHDQPVPDTETAESHRLARSVGRTFLVLARMIRQSIHAAEGLR